MHKERWAKKEGTDKLTILWNTKHAFNEREFLEEMNAVFQKHFGTPNPSIFEHFFIPIDKEEDDA